MLPARIASFLNAGDAVVADVGVDEVSTRRFTRIRPVPKPGVPREERRYLNSTWSVWEYWDFEFRRLTLRDGWQENEWDYDHYIVNDERLVAIDEASFKRALDQWVPNVAMLVHVTESAFPE
jgi:hypothetical protein